MAPWSGEVDLGAAAPDGGGCRGGGLKLPRCNGSMRQDHCLAWVWMATWMKIVWADGLDWIGFGKCKDRSSCYAGAAAPGHVGFGGVLDEDCVGRGFVDHDWIAFGQCEGRSGCYAGAAAPKQVVCVVAFVYLGRVGDGSSRLCGFLALFSS